VLAGWLADWLASVAMWTWQDANFCNVACGLHQVGSAWYRIVASARLISSYSITHQYQLQ
jgi:hypothetical protein